MKTPIYITSNNTILRKSGDYIIVDHKGHKIPCPSEGISHIVKWGNSAISEQLLNYLAEKGILVVRYSYGGKPGGIFLPPESNISKMRLCQYQAYFDNNKRMALAKEFVVSSALNKMTLLKKFKLETDFIEENLKLIKKSQDVDSLRGHEGTIANFYFQNLKKAFRHFNFSGREYNPPPDEINACLSFGYSILYSEILSKVYEHCLCPFLGYLHEQNNGNLSLVYDLSEVFKQDVDKFVLNLVNKGIIKEFHFNKKEGICMLDTSGKQVFLKQWMSLLRQTESHGLRKSSLSERIRKEIIKLKNCLEEGIKYEGHRI